MPLTYTVSCFRSEAGWGVAVPALEGAVTQATNLEQIPFLAAVVIDRLGGGSPGILELVGPEIVRVVRTDPPATQPPELTSRLRAGFEVAEGPVDPEFDEDIHRHGSWKWSVMDAAIRCTRRSGETAAADGAGQRGHRDAR